MGFAVGWDHEHGRFRGYGVPAFCDAKDCDVEIDRGLGWICEGHACGCYDEDDLSVTTFVCEWHTCEDVDWSAVREHPDWLNHVLTSSSWQRWRAEQPALVEQYRRILSEGVAQ